MRGSAAILLFLILLAACGDDNPVDSGPVAPDPALVGSWAFDSTDMFTTMFQSSAFADYIRDDFRDDFRQRGIDIDSINIDALMLAFMADPAFAELNAQLRAAMGITVIRFNADGSWEDSHGDSGTWREDDSIVIMGGYEIKYFVDGDDLILILPSEFLLDAFRADEDFTDEDVVLFRGIFDEDTNIRFFFKRR